jgi:hypothetical protein
MFDGSHRTNKREINLAGASASSKSSIIAVARRERQVCVYVFLGYFLQI